MPRRSELPINDVLTGDCIELLKTLPDRCIDLVFADPPYNLQLANTLLRPNQTVVDGVDDGWDKFSSFEEYDHFTRLWLAGVRRVLKDDGAIWVIGSYHNIFRVGAILLNLGYWILNDVIWHKSNPMPNFRGVRFTNATETLIWAKRSQRGRYTFNYHAMKALNDAKQMQNVWHIPLCRGEERIMIDGQKAHSTQKPEALLYRIILSSSNVGDIVLDPFFGSGTTGAVAKKLKRRFIGIEIDPAYAAIAQNRIDRIPEPSSPDELFETPSRHSLPRVSLGELLENGYITVGQKLFSPQAKHTATVRADATLVCDGVTGSIHKTAAAMQGVTAFNGWEYWHYEDNEGHMVLIDELRNRYRRENRSG